ncbi:TPM domain-containing protein [Methylotenera sp.]|uniref:TPM domain-containing protein n=1 Tax=Methylotenera sp. TaxID=2051956 RepID=UPI00271A3166|nr:TPM domain-containing protein [Methylotenera sp.]MDO9234260.1 TPM domain-containing protein [Methylotenera sp.]MDP2070815.1 TPM domain-containing protein [Methylotenera sp.]MDP3006341.1 TPM domain-containing protein [Methylotenera sp.]MDP3308014.1 TPM domain-containing protein [Methylotenera sp.]
MSLKFIQRLFKHLFVLPGAVRRYFPADSMRHIEAAIAASESSHMGEIRFVVESNLHIFDIFRGKSAKKRAIEVFSQFHVWDTAQNNGVLIYLLLADRDFEILADRGVHQHVGNQGWEKISHEMEAMFRHGQFEGGVIYGIAQIGALLMQHYPIDSENVNELPNTPIII